MAISQKAIITAVRKHRGNITAVAKSLGVSRGAIHNRINKSDSIKKAVQEARDAFDDEVESIHYDAVLKEENHVERIFHMKTRMRHRGYVEKQEVEQSGRTEIIIKHADD